MISTDLVQPDIPMTSKPDNPQMTNRLMFFVPSTFDTCDSRGAIHALATNLQPGDGHDQIVGEARQSNLVGLAQPA